jgi:general secretion pathway protein A
MPGGRGDAVTWLAESLDALGLYEATGQEVQLNGELLGAFKRFQFSHGLTPDGILGPLSLIHLNTAGDLAGPRLVARGES